VKSSRPLIVLSAEMAIVGLVSASLVSSYWLLWRFLPGTKTYSILAVGVALSAVLGGAVACYGSPRTNIWLSAGYAAVGIAVGVTTLLLSSGVLVSLMGS
jgi:hypothetical protein